MTVVGGDVAAEVPAMQIGVKTAWGESARYATGHTTLGAAHAGTPASEPCGRRCDATLSWTLRNGAGAEHLLE